MFKRLIAVVIVLFLVSVMKSFAAETESAPINLQIEHIGGKVSDTKNITDGVVSITIRTESAQPVVIPFGGVIFAKGGKSILQEYGYADLPKLSVEGEPWSSVGGGFSNCKYEWLDETDKVVLTGTYDISRPSAIISKNSSDAIVVPVKIPPNNGTYKLRITIDNRLIRMILKSYNSFDHSANYFFGELNTQASVHKL